MDRLSVRGRGRLPVAAAPARTVRPGRARGGERVARLLRPTVVLPTVAGVSLLAALLAFGNVRQVGALLGAFDARLLLAILLALLAYEAARCVQWTFLLRAEGIRVPLRSSAFAFLVGELARALPIGNYVGNYLLLRQAGTDFGLSAAATTLSVLIELAACLAGLVALGLGAWGWVRPLIVGGLAVFLAGAWATLRWYRGGSRPARQAVPPALRQVLVQVRLFGHGATALLRPRVLLPAAGLGAGYVALGGTTLYLVVRGLGLDAAAWPEVLAVYCFSIAFALIFPLPVDLGAYEASGAGAFLAVGLERSVAVGAMLLMRALTTGTAVAVALLTALVLRDQARAALRGRATAARGCQVSGAGC